MKRMMCLLGMVAGICGNSCSAAGSTNSAAPGRILLIEPSAMSVPAGKATLIIGPLQRTSGVYAGDYKVVVFPYFWKSRNGRISIDVSEAAMAQIEEAKVTRVTGTATTSGKNGKSRHIDARVTPADMNHGALKVWFVAEHQKMVFSPSYRLVKSRTTVAQRQRTEHHP